MTRLPSRRALLIGNATYQDSGYADLPSVHADLTAMQEILADRQVGGFPVVESLIDLTAEQMRGAIDTFLESSREDELTVLYFSGHGTRALDNGEFYFLATDTDAGQVDNTAVRAGFVNHLLQQCLAPQKVVIIDSCHSGGFATGFRTSTPGTKGAAQHPGRPASALTSRGVYVVSSSRAREASFAGADESDPSVFTSVVVDALRTGEPADGRREVAVDELFTYVNRKLRNRDAGQVPVISALGVDDRIILASSPQAPIQLNGGQEPIPGADLPATLVKSGAPDWPQLLDFYSRCLQAESNSWLSAADADENYVCLRGRERLLVGAMDTDHSIAVPAEAADFVAYAERENEQLWTGYPAVVVQGRMFARRKNNRSQQEFAPLLMRRVELVGPAGARRLSPVGPPIPHPALLHEFMTSDDAAVFTQNYQPTWHASGRAAMANDLRHLLRDDFEISTVQELDPEHLESSLDVDTPTDGARNAAILFRMPAIDGGPNKQLFDDFRDIGDKVSEIPRTALSALHPGTQPAVEAAPIRLTTPLHCNESQEAVIRSAMVQPLTVATGPPGTGKSQLVVNLVATAVANGQTVLIASTNNTAVDEVWRRCDKLLPGTVIRTGNRESRGNEQTGLSNLARLTPSETNIQTAALLTDATSTDLGNHRTDLVRIAELERNLLGTARTRHECARELRLEMGRIRDLFKIHSPASITRRATTALRLPLIAGWWCRRLLGRLDIPIGDDVDPKHLCAQLLMLATAETQQGELEDAEAERPSDHNLSAALNHFDEAMRSASTGLLDSVVRATAYAGRRQITALLNHNSGSDWPVRVAALRAARAWAVTAQSARRFPPNPGLFDLVIIDEASQCSIPTVLPLLFRAKRALIIGDPMQLTHITMGDSPTEAAAERAAQISSAWLDRHNMSYLRHSAFHAAERAAGGSLLLDEHFRCHPSIAAIANTLFYNGQLTVMTDTKALHDAEGDAVMWHEVSGSAERKRRGSWINRAEIATVVNLVQRLTSAGARTEHATIGVVTPFKSQAEAISKRLGNPDIRVGTVHKFQGGECDVMIFSLVATPDMPRGSIDWIDKQPNLWNVAITRAKSQLHIVGHTEVWEKRRIGRELISAADSDVVTTSETSELLGRLQGWLRNGSSTRIDFGVPVAGHHADALATHPDGTMRAYVIDPGCANGDPGRHLRLMLQGTQLRGDPRAGIDASRVPAWRLYD